MTPVIERILRRKVKKQAPRARGPGWGVWLMLAMPLAVGAQTPEWIWHANNGASAADNEVRYFRKAFEVVQPAAKAILITAADNRFTAYLNGQKVAAGDSWEAPVKLDVTKFIKAGPNVLAIEAGNDGGQAGLVAKLELSFAEGKPNVVVTDASWKASVRGEPGWEALAFQPGDLWVASKSLGNLGIAPWGNVFANRPVSGRSGGGPRQATPAEQLTTLPGFNVELVRNAAPDEGSWICMTADPTGRLILSPQDARQPFLRLTLDSQGRLAKQETIDLGVGEAMGLLYAFDSLYANARGPKGTGLYRLRDTNGDDRFDDVQFLKTVNGGGEHGPHAIVLGPDEKIYLMSGNHTQVPEGVSPQSPHRHFEEDQLLPRDWDGNGHARGILAPGGYIVRTDRDGREWELILAGFRNSYDFDFNADGEIFTFDSDMEWDWGMPWYRPTVVYHCVSGGDYGWRSGTGKWPWYYPDALPAAAFVGLGSPTGVRFGYGARFPAKYQRALYVMDWTYGRIMAIHLTPQGASYEGVKEAFVTGKPLNVADLVMGRDGAMYFITGGRGTQSGLYRVSYAGGEPTAPATLTQTEGAEARALRRKLEGFHGRIDPAALAAAWPHLDSNDRFIRHAARIAVESQPVNLWRQRALDERRVRASLTALLALARLGPYEDQQALFDSLDQLPKDSLDEEQKLEALRVMGLSFIRMGKPGPNLASDLVNALNPLYPSPSTRLNHELCRLLIYIEAPDAAQKTMDLLESSPNQEDQIHYLAALRTLESGWTLDLRRRYFSWYNRSRAGLKHPPEILQWFDEVSRPYSDGASFAKFLANFKKEAVRRLSEGDRASLASILEGTETVPASPASRARSFVRDWTPEDLLPSLDEVTRHRSFQRGREAFVDAQCVACHRFGNEGGSTGQDLTAVASRYTARDILDSILQPSKVVSEQYQNTTFELKDGEDVTGRVIDEKDGKLVVLVDPITDLKVDVSKANIRSQAPAKLSPMPEGLASGLTREDILDLLAYLQSGGNPNHAAFGK